MKVVKTFFSSRDTSRAPHHGEPKRARPKNVVTKFVKFFLRILFPSHCLSCSSLIKKDELFCAHCWPKLQFINEPKCRICSYPFESEITDRSLCSQCLAKRPTYDKIFTIFRYNQIISKTIGDVKYRNQTFLAKKLIELVITRLGDEIGPIDFIIAVPLHRTKLRRRKFNQAVLLARNLQKFFPEAKFYPNLLVKIKNTAPQTSLTQKQRQKNLKRAFLVKEKYREILQGKTVLLVDDVVTTGTTIENCAKELKRRKVSQIKVLTLAKTVLKS